MLCWSSQSIKILALIRTQQRSIVLYPLDGGAPPNPPDHENLVAGLQAPRAFALYKVAGETKPFEGNEADEWLKTVQQAWFKPRYEDESRAPEVFYAQRRFVEDWEPFNVWWNERTFKNAKARPWSL